MTLSVLVWTILAVLHIGLPTIYLLFMHIVGKNRSWRLTFSSEYKPTVTVIIPTYNEERTIVQRLKNLVELRYPKGKMQAIIVDSASDDCTRDRVRDFIETQPGFSITLIEEEERRGKGRALNEALKSSTGEIVAISDADSLWHPNVLEILMKYLCDPRVGATTGREVVVDQEGSMTNETERAYRSVYDIIRLGESKIYATPIFDGELSAFKRHVIEEFEATSGPDDTGTALELIQKGYRTIFVPEALYFDTMPRRWRAKISIKKRRALHLVQIFAKMSKSILRKRRALPLRIALPEIYLHLVNPIIFVFCLAASLLVIVENPCLLFPLLGVMIWPRTRILAVTYMTSHFLLLDGILGYLRGQNPTIWKKVSHVAT